MKLLDIRRWPINDDAESELRFWVRELSASVKSGAASTLAAGLLIMLLHGEAGGDAGRFMVDMWPALLEFSFWLGMLAGLLWGGSKRLGSALAAGLPWRTPRNEKEERARTFGQWAAFAACTAFFLWLGAELALSAGLPAAIQLAAALQPVQTACWLSCLLFAGIALAGRPRRQRRPGANPP